MIKTLQIKNYAIIEELEVRFSKGLTIITGETGAGKSILLGALGLIMGKRADSKSLYNTAQKCVIEACFLIEKYGLEEFFEANDIDYEIETVVRREITPSGKSRAFVNDTPVNLKVLQELCSNLVDLHQQFDNQELNDVSFQLKVLDSLAENEEVLGNYHSLYKKYQSNQKKLKSLLARNENATQEIDFLHFQLDELNKAELEAGEQEALEAELSKLTNAETIKSRLSSAFMYLNQAERSILSQLKEVELSLNQIRQFHPDLDQLLQKLEGLTLELQEVAGEFEDLAEGTEHNPQRVQEVQERLDLIYKLQNKHRVSTVSDLLLVQADIAQRLTSFEDLSNEIVNLEKVIGKEEQTLYQLAQILSKRRKFVVNNFQEKVHRQLIQLAMEYAQLKVLVEPVKELLPTGTDDVEFLFAPNKGSRFLPIKNVASGGELSRLILCVKSLVASSIPLPTLIFDEIDSGISGNVALKMGKILRKLSNEHQVVVITHSPQVASKADRHYFVYKRVNETRTVAKVRHLNEAERIRAIATMLSTSPPSDSAIENAKELLAMG